MSQRLERLGQPVIVENKPGAGTNIGVQAVISSPPDGYTLGVVGNGQAIATTLFTKLPYDVLRDFTPISVAASFPVLVAVSGDSPYRSITDVVAAARQNPGDGLDGEWNGAFRPNQPIEAVVDADHAPPMSHDGRAHRAAKADAVGERQSSRGSEAAIPR